jgi:HSP20 family protein
MANLVPYQLRDSVGRLREGISEAFDRWLPERFRREDEPGVTSWPSTLFSSGGPAVDVIEEDDAVKVAAEMPGLSDRDFRVEILNDRLVLHGEKKASHRRKDRDYYFSECAFGSFRRVIDLPCEIDADKATATYKHGVLNVVLPKTENSKAKRVKVNIS